MSDILSCSDPTSFMATMASTSHGLSAFANTCVKSPLNPKTGLSASLKERSIVRFDNDYNELGNSYNYSADGRAWARANTGGKHSLSVSIDDLQSAKEEEFYEKLQQLKTENGKVMQAYERLYKEKLLREGLSDTQSNSHHLDKSGFDREVENGTSSLVVNGTGHVSIPGDIAVLSKKPPPGNNVNALTETPIFSEDGPQRSIHRLRKDCLNSGPVNRKSHSLDEEQWRKAFFHEKKEDDPDNYVIATKESLENSYERNVAKINSMWDDFEIPTTFQRRHSFSSVPKKNSNDIEDKKAKTTGWRHRITIPKPFNMSVREALKEKKKTSAQLELESRRRAKEREEETECEKKFKAQPAPSHIYIPLYDEIMEKKETRRKYVKQYCQDLLMSKVKPFNFEAREKDKQQQRLLSGPIPQPSRDKQVKNTFKATPVPKRIFSSAVDEKQLEDEELRKIRIRMRSKELLRESSLPPNMAAREQLKEQEKKEAAKKAMTAARRQKKQRPRSAYAVPDYDALYREFQKELARHKITKEGTVVEPFDLETNHIRASKQKIKRDIEMDEKNLKENRWPYQSSRETPRSSLNYLGALSTSLDSIPAYSTKAADLRNSRVKKEKEQAIRHKEAQEEGEARRRARESKLRRFLTDRTDSTPNPRESIAARLKRIKQDDRERQENYQRELQEMKARVESNPLLVEKFMKEHAKKEAEKKFATTLHGVGIDGYEVISHRGSGTQSMRSVDVEDEILADRDTYYADQTYTKDLPSEERYEDYDESL